MHACSKNSVYGRARLQTNWRADDSSPKASENGRVPQGRHKGLHTIRRRLGAPDRDQCNANVSGSGSGPLVQGLIATRSARRIPCSHLRCNTQRQSATVAVVGCASDYRDRKSTRLNSSHVSISYAVFCLKKKKTTQRYIRQI